MSSIVNRLAVSGEEDGMAAPRLVHEKGGIRMRAEFSTDQREDTGSMQAICMAPYLQVSNKVIH